MKAQSFGKQNSGFSTLEILIAFAILTLSMTAIITVVFGNQSLAVDTQTNIEAISKAQTQLEAARALSRQSFDSVGTIGQSQDDIYYKSLEVTTAADDSYKTVTSHVTWASLGRNLGIDFTTLLTNPFANVCNPSLSDANAWKNPQIYPPGSPAGFPTTELVKQSPLGSNANGLGIGDLKVYRQTLYVAANAPAGADTHTLYVAHVPNDPNSSPQFLGWAPTIGGSLNAVTVAPYGNKLYAYVANAYSPTYTTCLTGGAPDSSKCAQLQIIDVTPDISGGVSPAVVKNVVIAAKTGGATPKLAAGKSIFYYKGYLYVGLTIASGSGSEFNIFDVGGGTGSPKSPVPMGTYPVAHTINGLFVKDNYAYLATTDTGGSNKQLLILNISNKSSPHFNTAPVGGFFNPGGIGVGNAIQVIGTRAYLGRAFSGSTVPNFYILDTTNPASYPSALSQVGPGLIAGTNDSVNGVNIRGDDSLRLAFLVTNTQFQIWNITTPTAISSWASPISLSSLGANGSGEALNCTGNYLYIGAAFKDAGNNSKDIIATIGPQVSSVYTLSPQYNSLSIAQGSSGDNVISKNLVSGFPPGESLAVSGLPVGATYSFVGNSSCAAPCSTTLHIVIPVGTLTGPYTVLVQSPSGVQTTFTLNVGYGPFDYGISNDAPSGKISVKQTQSGVVTIPVTLVTGASRAVSITLASSPALPASVALNFDQTSCSPGCSYTLTIRPATDPATKNQSYTITITGSPGDTGTHATSFVLTVKP